MTPDTPEAGRAYQPRSLIVSFYGAFGREVGGRLAIADLIALLGQVDVDAPSVRSAVSRLKRRGLLEARQVDGAAGYTLSESAREMLADGDRRIYERHVARPGDGWVLAVFSIPESERHKRHVLRSRLARMGFGTAAPGVWIAPGHLSAETRHTLWRLGLDGYVHLFGAEYLAFAELRTAVGRWWDLESLGALHEEFVRAHEPVLERWSRRDTTPGVAAFADYLRAVDAWRRVPYADPGLPPELLPADWPGTRAADVFFGLHARLRDPGLRYVRNRVTRL